MIELKESDELKADILLKNMYNILDDEDSFKIPLEFIEFAYSDFEYMTSISNETNTIYENLESFSFKVLYSPIYDTFYVSESDASFDLYTLIKVNLTCSNNKRTSPLARLFINRLSGEITDDVFKKESLKYLKNNIRKKIIAYQKNLTIRLLDDNYSEENILELLEDKEFSYKRYNALILKDDVDILIKNYDYNKHQRQMSSYFRDTISEFDLTYILKNSDFYEPSMYKLNYEDSKFNLVDQNYYFGARAISYFSLSSLLGENLEIDLDTFTTAYSIKDFLENADEINIHNVIKTIENNMFLYVNRSRVVESMYKYFKEKQKRP